MNPTNCLLVLTFRLLLTIILLEAVDLGLGAVWLGVYPIKERMEFIKKLFDLPDNIIPFSVIPIGYTERENKFVDRFNEEKIHYNKW